MAKTILKAAKLSVFTIRVIQLSDLNKLKFKIEGPWAKRADQPVFVDFTDKYQMRKKRL